MDTFNGHDTIKYLNQTLKYVFLFCCDSTNTFVPPAVKSSNFENWKFPFLAIFVNQSKRVSVENQVGVMWCQGKQKHNDRLDGEPM